MEERRTRHDPRGVRRQALAGVEIPASHGDPAGEALAARRSAAVIDRSARGKVWLTGGERVDFLHRMTSADVKGVPVGRGGEACLLSEKGHILVHFRFRILDEGVWIDCEPELTGRLREILDRFIIMDDVRIEDRTRAWGILTVVGPGGADALRAAALPEPPPGEHRPVAEGFVASDDALGLPGFDLVLPRAGIESAWEALLRAVRARGGGPAGGEAFEILRVEAGRARYGAEATESDLPLESGLEGAVSLDKGCYPGQEVIERVTARGQLHWGLGGVEIEGPPPERGTPLLLEGREVGRVTSAVVSPTLGRTIALARLRSEASRVGLEMEAAGKRARVVKLPFLPPPAAS